MNQFCIKCNNKGCASCGINATQRIETYDSNAPSSLEGGTQSLISDDSLVLPETPEEIPAAQPDPSISEKEEDDEELMSLSDEEQHHENKLKIIRHKIGKYSFRFF
ncbi:hypothetical protein DMENIID0001_060440 [Sergentomyia squamirostris]